jgi:hypothetical protein
VSSRTITSIFFDGQFWVAEIERHTKGSVEVARYCFGAEPTNAEMLEWVDLEFPRLRFHSHDAKSAKRSTTKVNPKRKKRIAATEAQCIGFSTKAQDAMQEALAVHKMERRSHAKWRTEEDQERRWAQRQVKMKARRKGH